MVESIPGEDLVSRLIDSPNKWSADERKFIEVGLFEFSSAEGEVESVVWRKYAREISDVHAHGCAMQKTKRAAKPGWTYEGAVSADVASIRAIRTADGDVISVVHEPSEGPHHVHIGLVFAGKHECRRQRKANLKEHLRNVFTAGGLAPHACV